MIDLSIKAFSGKRVQLLQGPVGPFFARLAVDLQHAGATVFKINFNAGDWLFYPKGGINYRGTMEAWPSWFEQQLLMLQIDVIILFGDCRPIHMAAHTVAARYNLEVWVFEEGYIRPDYVTLERYGVNGNSRMPRQPEAYKDFASTLTVARRVAMPYWHMVWFGFCYFAAGSFGKLFFMNYRHHRPLNFWQALPWIRSVWRKQWYRIKERGRQAGLIAKWRKRYFFVPLQVYNDSQVIEHADVGGVEGFIEIVLCSFANHAPKDVLLVFKHHPMDRGYRDYTQLIKKLSNKLEIASRVIYLHDQCTLTLLNNAKGVVVINSTVGLSALAHRIPTKVLGQAIYDVPQLTFQGGLDDFWKGGVNSEPDPDLYQCFENHLIAYTQINGNFYRPLRVPGSRTGLIWKG